MSRKPIRKPWLPEPDWFWKRIDKNGPQINYVQGRCWVWARLIGPRGYGAVRQTTAKGRGVYATLTAHRVAWELIRGPIPNDLLVLHHCDNRACVRPDHLFLGDDKANIDDMYKKGRENKACGERQHLSKLTADDVRTIRKERAKCPPTPIAKLARMFDVSHPLISYAAIGKTWAHITDVPPVVSKAQGRLTKDDVREIRRLAPTTSRVELAERFGVIPNTIYRIAQRKRWKRI